MSTKHNNHDFTIEHLGKCSIPSPLTLSNCESDFISNYVTDDDYIIYNVNSRPDTTITYTRQMMLEEAGPREKIYFDPAKTKAGIVTCGGLCPGLNDVIRSIVMCLWYSYGVRNIHGIRYGYRGFLPEFKLPTIDLEAESVADINRTGGTILGSSRGFGDRTSDVVDAIERMNLSMLFTLGGDGTQRGALAIADEAKKRGLKLSVIGIPKTIDNDLSFIQKSFGFETAVSHAVEAVMDAHVEAKGVPNGVGIVRVMGRESGFIAAHTTLATSVVNFVLVPEVPFDLEGTHGLLHHLDKRLDGRGHAVILIAEGAGQSLMPQSHEKDASGNEKLGDIGVLLRQKITEHFKKEKKEVNIRYIDPSYMIRSAPANPNDSIYCARLGTNAVHAAMAGRNKMIISMINYHFVHVPISAVVSRRNKIDPESPLWRDVITATGQPPLMSNKPST